MLSQDEPNVAPETGAVARSRALEALPPGYVSRALTTGDVNALWELEAAGEVFDDGVVEVDLSDLEAEWRQPDFDSSIMSIGVFWDDRLVAYAKVFQGNAR